MSLFELIVSIYAGAITPLAIMGLIQIIFFYKERNHTNRKLWS